MNSHVPDLERCKALSEAGFKGETQFVWVRNELKEWRVITVYENTWTELLDSPYYQVIRAPIVTELIEEIPGLRLGDANIEPLWITPGHDGGWCVGYGWYVNNHTDTLPNALADLWLWLRERGE